MRRRQFPPQLRMPHGEQFEFHDQHRPAAVGDPRSEKRAQSRPALRFGLATRQDRPDLLHAPPSFLLEHGEEQIFLGAEVRVESATRMPRGRRYIFNAAGFKAVAREDPPRGAEQRPPRGIGAQLVLVARRRFFC